jgi:membrane associated rhomboid family serine protease
MEKHQHEYEQVCDTLRHYSNLRFVVLTVFFAFVGGDVAFIYGREKTAPLSPFVALAAKMAGVYGTLIFWFIEWRISGYVNSLEKRAKELEEKLDYKIFHRRAETKFKVMFLFWPMYVGTFLFWIASFFTKKG